MGHFNTNFINIPLLHTCFKRHIILLTHSIHIVIYLAIQSIQLCKIFSFSEHHNNGLCLIFFLNILNLILNCISIHVHCYNVFSEQLQTDYKRQFLVKTNYKTQRYNKRTYKMNKNVVLLSYSFILCAIMAPPFKYYIEFSIEITIFLKLNSFWFN